MPREIKFRAFDKDKNEWFGKPFSLREAMALTWLHTSPTVNLIFMQYTGLKDKNGKGIYEGDIVRQTSLLQSRRTTIDVIEWERDGFVMLNGGRIGRENRLEVIGNIYENPELLT